AASATAANHSDHIRSSGRVGAYPASDGGSDRRCQTGERSRSAGVTPTVRSTTGRRPTATEDAMNSTPGHKFASVHDERGAGHGLNLIFFLLEQPKWRLLLIPLVVASPFLLIGAGLAAFV